MPGRTIDVRAAAVWRDLSTRLAQPRRLLVAALAAVAVVCGINAARPAPIATGRVWVATRDLSGGAPIAATDVSVESVPRPDVPGGAVPVGHAVVGRLLAAPVRRGEPITDVRLLSPSLLSALDPPGAVAVTVRVADGPAATALVHAGDLVDVIATTDPDAAVTVTDAVVVHDVRVLAIPTESAVTAADGSSSGGLLIVAADHRQAAALATAAASSRLSVAVRRPT